MLKNMAIPNRIHWTEGMILLPQHFHLSDNYVDAMCRAAMMNSRPYYWGLESLAIDSTMLAEGVLRLVRFSGIFPDATPVTVGGGGDGDVGEGDLGVSISLSELELEANKPVFISVAISQENPKSASDFDGDLKRYSSVNTGSVSDVTNPESMAEIVCIQPLLRLVLHDTMSPNHVGFPVLLVEKSLDGTYKLLPYVPPILRFSDAVGSSDILTSRVMSVIRDARTKAAQIRNLVIGRRSGRTNSDEQRRRVIRLSADLPVLESKLQGELPPFEVYSALLSYAAGLSEISDTLVVPVFKPYAHNNLMTSFDEVLSFIEEIIAGIRLDFEAIAFEEVESGRLVCDLSERELQHAVILSVTVPENLTKESVIAWSETALICGTQDLDEALQSRSIGYPRQHVVEFSQFGLLEGVNEVLIEVHVPHDHLDTLVVRGSEASKDYIAASSVFCFVTIG